jgi:putative ABC transport system permease protein
MFAAILVPLTIIGAAAWIALLAFQNVRERRSEIGILRALGMRSSGLVSIFLAKAALTGLIGAAIGYAAGLLIGARFAETSAAATAFDARLLVSVLVLAPVLSMLAAWLPALAAARQDPAATLSEA